MMNDFSHPTYMALNNTMAQNLPGPIECHGGKQWSPYEDNGGSCTGTFLPENHNNLKNWNSRRW